MQDEGSQLAALLAERGPGMRVVDFCAGAGGKTLALAAAMDNRGKLVACDVARAAARARRRSGCAAPASAMSSAARSSSERDQWVKRHARQLRPRLRRCALHSAPAPGAATPTPNGALRPKDLAELVERQRDILDSAARLVKPGGRLIYATCSLLREENEAQAEASSPRTPDFALLPGRARLGRDDRRQPARPATIICA